MESEEELDESLYHRQRLSPGSRLCARAGACWFEWATPDMGLHDRDTKVVVDRDHGVAGLP